MILDGKKARESLSQRLEKRLENLGFKPKLVIFQIGNDEQSSLYIEKKKQFAKKIGVEVECNRLANDISTEEVISEIKKANIDQSTQGIIVQLPVPKHLDTTDVIEAISPQKDADGLTSHNLKLLWEGSSKAIVPATALGIFTLLDFYGIDVSGKHVGVIGRSSLVGKPTALLALKKNATVTVCHSKTKDLDSLLPTFDILISATGYPGLVTVKSVRKGQTVIDVGISVDYQNGERAVSGDVDFSVVQPIVENISPVPGGVGPMTVYSLFENLINLSEDS